MRKKSILLHVIGVLLSFTFFSCVKYEATSFDGKILPRKSGYSTGVTNDWIYFNLRTGEMFNAEKVNQDIKEGEQKERTDWDIAFCGFVLRTNSGTSGIGKGGAIDLGYGGYENWTTVSQLPENPDWVTDNEEVEVTMSQNDWNHSLIENGIMDVENYPWFDPNSGPRKTKTSANPLLAEAMTFAGPPPVYTPSYHTYVVRTADGKRFFKIQLVSWYDPEVEIGDEGGRISYYCDELK